MRQLPAHHDHQRKSEQKEQQRRDGVLDADDFMIRRKDVLLQKVELVMLSMIVRIGM